MEQELHVLGNGGEDVGKMGFAAMICCHLHIFSRTSRIQHQRCDIGNTIRSAWIARVDRSQIGYD